MSGIEALAAVGLAANILQFVEFVSKLFNETQAIYKSDRGQSTETAEIELVARSLGYHIQKLRKRQSNMSVEMNRLTNNVPRNSSGLGTTASGLFEVEPESPTRKLAESCLRIANELKSAVERLQRPMRGPRKWTSFIQALRTVLGKEEIRNLQKRLETLRSAFFFNFQMIISTQLEQIHSSLKHLLGAVSSETHIVAEQREANRVSELTTLANSIQSGLQLESERDNNMEWTRNLKQMSKGVNHVVGVASDTRRKRQILRALQFENINQRCLGISTAYEKTFEWIFDSNPGCQWNDWLLNDEQVFWISGKPGSGKSTLMKFLFQHAKTQKGFSKWAKQSKILKAQFYFWMAGTKLQKSLQGLLQSLLFTILLDMPELIPSVYTDDWSIIEETDALKRHHSWELSDLKRTLYTVLGQLNTDQQVKICFFIDGLDEFDGDHFELIDFIKSLRVYDNLKFCLSSRPWNVFEAAFGNCQKRKFYLEDLTQNDIRHFVLENLETLFDTEFQEEPERVSCLFEEVILKAQGVFLWVFLVTRSLRDGITNGDSLQILENRVRSFPSELYDFFNHMFCSVNSIYQYQSATLFRIALHGSPNSLYLLTCSFLMGDDPHMVLQESLDILHSKQLGRRCKQAKKRLFARCQGLLEICDRQNGSDNGSGSTVTFLHRTVRDFLQTKQMWELLSEILGPDFDPAPPYAMALLGSLKCCPALLKPVYYEKNKRYYLEIIQLIQKSQKNGRMNDHCHIILDQCCDLSLKRRYISDEMVFQQDIIRAQLHQYIDYRLKKDDNFLPRFGQSILGGSIDYTLSESQPDLLDSRIQTVIYLLQCGIDHHEHWIRLFDYFTYPTVDKATNWHRLVEALTSHGLDPNIRFQGLPIWAYYLRDLVYFPAGPETKLHTLEHLLRAGADLNSASAQESGQQHPSTSVWCYFLSKALAMDPYGESSSLILRIIEMLLRHGADPLVKVRLSKDGSGEEASFLAAIQARFTLNPYLANVLRVLQEEVSWVSETAGFEKVTS